MPGLPPILHHATQAIRTWALVPGFREWVLVALVVVALYGRSDRSRLGRWSAAAGRWFPRPGRLRPGSRAVRWAVERWRPVLALLAGAAVAAWVATSLRVVRVQSVP